MNTIIIRKMRAKDSLSEAEKNKHTYSKFTYLLSWRVDYHAAVLEHARARFFTQSVAKHGRVDLRVEGPCDVITE